MESLGRYELRGELGRGGMGVVYRAYDPTLDREVAIKSVRLDGVTEAERASLEERLSREARSAAQLRHPNIVQVYDFFRIDDRAFIVMEYVRGAMLEAMIVAGVQQNVPMIVQVLRQAASALDAAHAEGIVHRDIKPGNMLLDEMGNIKITDFGIARRMASGATETQAGFGTTVGTLGYMAPEQIRGESVDGRADQFSLGVVAYQLFTGQMPFQADSWIALSYKIIHEMPTPASSFNPLVSPVMQAAIERATAKDPAARFPRCVDFVDALAANVTGKPDATGSLMKKVLILAPLATIVAAIVLGMVWRARDTVTQIGDAPPPVPMETAGTAPAKVEPPTGPVSLAAPATTAPTAAVSLSLVIDGLPMEFAQIPAGQFFMGSDVDTEDQRPRHLVRLTQPFQIGRTEVTDKQWNAVMTGKATGSNLPKANVSWNSVQGFLGKLNALNDGFVYRLPTEAEWEYAARANSPDDRPRNVDDVAWYQSNSGQVAHEIATRIPNAFGLYDMLGNVSEWTADWADMEYYRNAPAADPKGPKTGQARVVRGGNFDTQPMTLSVCWRFADAPDAKFPEIGFRVVRVPK
jgi:formylglycine-generating enzyme required for sulfatase activity/predicted Ser/Thr protein kinase